MSYDTTPYRPTAESIARVEALKAAQPRSHNGRLCFKVDCSLHFDVPSIRFNMSAEETMAATRAERRATKAARRVGR